MGADLLTAAACLLHPQVSRQGYAIAYGSHARGTSTRCSDLDLLVVARHPANPDDLDALITGVKLLHHRHGLALDQEVSYQVKLYATFPEVATALAFGGFTVHATGDLSVPPVVASPEFLNSTPFKLRLILNALTSAHVFLGGEADRFEADDTRACQTLALLSLSILAYHDSVLERLDLVTVARAVDALVTDPGSGSTGEDYLGYRIIDRPALFGRIQRGFARLIHVGVLHPIDGTTFTPDHSARRALVFAEHRRLAGPAERSAAARWPHAR